MALIRDRVASARLGTNPMVMCRMRSGWAVMGDVQFLPGYTLLLPDPVVHGLNELTEEARAGFLLDMALIGDALLETTGATRINYEILGNTEPELHAHIFPRYPDEAEDLRLRPAWFYDWKTAPVYSEAANGELRVRITEAIIRLSNRQIQPVTAKPAQADLHRRET